MKKLLFLFLALPFFFASCSSDDKDDVEPEIRTFKIEVKTISYNKISLDWNKVSEAYSYQVFYKAEGASKWETSNSIMPIDNGMTVHWNGDFASFAPDTKYSVQVKAFRDSREGSVMAESNILEIKTLTEEEVLIVGKWELEKYSTSVKSNLEKYDEAIADYIIRNISIGGTAIPDFKMYLEFDENLTFKSYILGEEEEGISRTYKIENGEMLHITSYDEETEKMETTIHEFVVSRSVFYGIMDVKDELDFENDRELKAILGDDINNYKLENAALLARYKRVQ